MPPASGVAGFHGLTGGVYKARERIHRGMLIRDYKRFHLHDAGLQASIRTETPFAVSLAITDSPPAVDAIVVRV